MFVSKNHIWASLNELRDFLGATSRYLLIGIGAQSSKKFESFVVEYKGKQVRIGIQSSDFGIPSQVAFITGAPRILVGHDCEIFIIDVENLALVAQYELDGPFYKFIADEMDHTIFAVHELGVWRIDPLIGRQWIFDTKDILSECVLAQRLLKITIADASEPIILNPKTGQQIV
ncbi:MAG: hypothetical protein JNL45_06565 [Hyphomicrobium sp.]|nr:hypothetical protein [Hyphomicrobium sp.]